MFEKKNSPFAVHHAQLCGMFPYYRFENWYYQYLQNPLNKKLTSNWIHKNSLKDIKSMRGRADPQETRLFNSGTQLPLFIMNTTAIR